MVTPRERLERWLARWDPADVKRVIDDYERDVRRRAAAEIREETEALKRHGVLEPDKYRPCRDAANQIDPDREEVEL